MSVRMPFASFSAKVRQGLTTQAWHSREQHCLFRRTSTGETLNVFSQTGQVRVSFRSCARSEQAREQNLRPPLVTAPHCGQFASGCFRRPTAEQATLQYALRCPWPGCGSIATPHALQSLGGFRFMSEFQQPTPQYCFGRERTAVKAAPQPRQFRSASLGPLLSRLQVSEQ